MADDVFYATRQASSGFGGVGTIKAKLLNDARVHCEKSSQKVEIIQLWNNEGPFVFGNFPRAEIKFESCSPDHFHYRVFLDRASAHCTVAT